MIAMIEDILGSIYETNKHEPRGFSQRLHQDLSQWVDKEYKELFGMAFDSDSLRKLSENIDCKLPNEFDYESLVQSIKSEIIELKRRNYTDLQIAFLVSVIGEKDLLDLERRLGKPKKTFIGQAIKVYSKSSTTRERFVSRVNEYFRNYNEIVELFDSKGREIAKSIAHKAFIVIDLEKALARALELYDRYNFIYDKYKKEDEDIAKSIAIRAFSASNYIGLAERFHGNFRRIYNIYSKRSPNLAKSIAHWTFMAENPEEQARKIYDKIKKEGISTSSAEMRSRTYTRSV